MTCQQLHVQLDCHICFVSTQVLGSSLFHSKSLTLLVSINAAGSVCEVLRAGDVLVCWAVVFAVAWRATCRGPPLVPTRFSKDRPRRATSCHWVHLFYPRLKRVVYSLYSRLGIEACTISHQGTVVHHSQCTFDIHQPEFIGIFCSQVPGHHISLG